MENSIMSENNYEVMASEGGRHIKTFAKKRG